MKIDLHIHTSTGSDGAFTLEEVFREARKRNIDLMSVTDHDAIHHQPQAIVLAKKYGIAFVTGVELNVTWEYKNSSVSLDFLGYSYDPDNGPLKEKLDLIKEHREKRGRQIIDNLNVELSKEDIPLFTDIDLNKMQEGVDGTLGRPHIADYLISKGIVGNRQEAFDRYLVKCDVPKYPLRLFEASELIRNAGGVLVHAHPNDPNGTSLVKVTTDLAEQTSIIEKHMLDFIDGIECWHSRNDTATTAHYIEFCKRHNLLMTGGSDCHQKPVLLGTVNVPDLVVEQFKV